MFAPLKLGLLVISIMILLALVYPLMVFTIEVLGKPDNLPKLQVNATAVNETHVKLIITVSYNGTVVLKDFSIELVNVTTVYYGDVSAGSYTKEVIVPREKIENGVDTVVVRFSLAGLYPMEFREKVSS